MIGDGVEGEQHRRRRPGSSVRPANALPRCARNRSSRHRRGHAGAACAHLLQGRVAVADGIERNQLTRLGARHPGVVSHAMPRSGTTKSSTASAAGSRAASPRNAPPGLGGTSPSRTSGCRETEPRRRTAAARRWRTPPLTLVSTRTGHQAARRSRAGARCSTIRREALCPRALRRRPHSRQYRPTPTGGPRPSRVRAPRSGHIRSTKARSPRTSQWCRTPTAT